MFRGKGAHLLYQVSVSSGNASDSSSSEEEEEGEEVVDEQEDSAPSRPFGGKGAAWPFALRGHYI